jgi:hypothetical protein
MITDRQEWVRVARAVFVESPASTQENDIRVLLVSVSVMFAALAHVWSLELVVVWARCSTVSVGRGETRVSEPVQPRVAELMVPEVAPPVRAMDTFQLWTRPPVWVAVPVQTPSKDAGIGGGPGAAVVGLGAVETAATETLADAAGPLDDAVALGPPAAVAPAFAVPGGVVAAVEDAAVDVLDEVAPDALPDGESWAVVSADPLGPA